MRVKAGIIIVVLSTFIALFSLLLASLVVVVGIALIYPEAVLLLYENIFGFPPLEVRVKRGYYVIGSGKKRRVTAIIRVLDVQHGLYDLNPIQFWGQSKFILEGLVIDPDAYYDIVFSKREYFIRVSIEESNPKQALIRLSSIVNNLLRHLKSYGIKARYLENVSISLEFVKTNPKWSIFSSLAILAVSLIKIGLKSLYSLILGLALLSMLFIIYLDYQRVKTCLSLKKEILVLSNNESFYTSPGYSELLNRARWLNSLVNSTDAVFILRLKPVEQSIADNLDLQAYRAYELGTALDKLSLLARSERIYRASERRWKRREQIYSIQLLILCDGREAKRIERSLNQLGLRINKPLIKMRYLDTII